jgi:3-methyladenine DNA glycosylase Tag
VTPFKSIRARAARRKGGEQALAALLPPAPDPMALARLADDRVLAEMARRIFSAGFVWSVIESKWGGFEDAFLGFEPRRLMFQPEDFWHGLTSDKRIVRNGAKIMAARANAKFVTDVAAEHGSFGKFLAAWPVTDQVGLIELLGKRGTRLGGNTGQYFLRFVGWDSYLLSRDVVACLRDAGLEIAETPTSKKDRRAIQAQFNAWHRQTGLPMHHLSRICALSIGQNYDVATLRRFGGQEE